LKFGLAQHEEQNMKRSRLDYRLKLQHVSNLSMDVESPLMSVRLFLAALAISASTTGALAFNAEIQLNGRCNGAFNEAYVVNKLTNQDVRVTVRRQCQNFGRSPDENTTAVYPLAAGDRQRLGCTGSAGSSGQNPFECTYTVIGSVP
jgi:hypothetical protein